MTPFAEVAALAANSALLGWSLTGLLVRALGGARHRDVPNERSMHTIPVPTQGGLAIVATVTVLALVWRWPPDPAVRLALVAAAALSLLGWIDQHRPLWPLTRLLAQVVAVGLCLSQVPEAVRFMPVLSLASERLLIGLAWLWLINLTNFMDGIDGLAGTQGVSIATGYAAVLAWTAGTLTAPPAILAIALAGACLGYLVWNWHPARIFMGDAGSIPIGFLTGFLLLDLASKGHVGAALVLPLCFAADATLTLTRRLLAGHAPWRAHKTHFYQRAVTGGAKPPEVVGWLVLANVGLIVIACGIGREIWLAAALGLLVALGWLTILSALARGPSPPDTKPMKKSAR